MFAKAQWFRPNARGRVRPRTFLGWMYMLGWSLALAIPALFLVAIRHQPEAVIWVAAMALAWRWDLRPVRTAHRLTHQKDLFVIDDETDITRLTTDKFDLTAQRS